MKKNILFSIATLGPLGSLPMPGTIGTFAALPLVACMHLLDARLQALFVLNVAWLSYLILSHAADQKELARDPGCIIIDEVVGCLFTFLWIPLTLSNIAIGCALFRVLDIFKPFGIRHVERIGGAAGILVDDVLAGIIANCALQIIASFYL